MRECHKNIILLTLIIIYIVLIFFLNVVISEAPKERPRLQLKPRSDRTASSEEKETSTKSSIFGAAKPVDTAKKEAEIDLIQTAPNVTYELKFNTGEVKLIDNPQDVPDAGQIEEFREPIVPRGMQTTRY